MTEKQAIEKIKNADKYYRLKGEFIGTLKGILLWDIPKKLSVKIKEILKRLEA